MKKKSLVLQLVLLKKKSKILFSILLFSFIASWQTHYLLHPNIIPKFYQLKASTGGGMHVYYAYLNYLFFLKRTGHFPVGHNALTVESDKNFDSWFQNNKSDLVNEIFDTYRMGEHGKIFMLLFDSFFRDNDFKAQYTIFNFIFFLTSLFLFCFSYWDKIGVFWSVLITLLMGSSLFQLYEVFNSNNLFSLPISLSLLLIAINSDLFLRREIKSRFYINFIITGFLLGYIYTIRTEPIILLVPFLFLIFINPLVSFSKKIIFSLIVVFCFFSSNYLINNYFERKFYQAQLFLKENGANPYNHKLQKNHDFWHPVFCGLGDFAERSYYVWNDLVAYEYVLPILREKLNRPDLWLDFKNKEYFTLKRQRGEGYSISEVIYMNEFYDTKKHYVKKIEDYPEFTEIEKEKILSDIKEDPKWYATILLKRLFRIFSKTTGVGISIHSYFIHFNHQFLGFFSIVSLLLSYLKKDYFYSNVIFFNYFLSVPSFLIYSGHGTTYYSIAHIFGVVYIFKFLFTNINFYKGLIELIKKQFLKKT